MVRIEQFGARLRDMSVSQVFAHHSAILGLHKAIIIGVSGSGFGEMDQKLVQQFGYNLVDEFGAIIGMKPFDNERELG